MPMPMMYVTLAVGNLDHTWSEEDVFVPVPAGGMTGLDTFIEDDAIAQWRDTNDDRKVAYLKAINWGYAPDAKQEYDDEYRARWDKRVDEGTAVYDEEADEYHWKSDLLTQD